MLWHCELDAQLLDLRRAMYPFPAGRHIKALKMCVEICGNVLLSAAARDI